MKRQIVLEGQPRPFVTPDALASRAVGAAHARAMADQARAIAAQCRPSPAFRVPPPYDPAAAARHADIQREEIERKRVFLADRLRGLMESGRITRQEFRAADEIAMLFEWSDGGRQLMARSQFRERLSSSTGDAMAAAAHLEEIERTRYTPWRQWASEFPVKPTRSLEDLTKAVAVQRLGMRQAADAYGMDQRRVLVLVKRSLSCYAVLAGWLSRSEFA